MSPTHKFLAAVFVGCALPMVAGAQPFPTKPVRIVVPYEPGGAVDILARAVSPRMSEELGQPVVIDNRGGAGGRIGADIVARSSPDGYTLMLTVGATHILNMFTQKNLPYHPIKDFTPITSAADTVLSVAAAASFPVNSIKELIEYAKRSPGGVAYGTTSVGGLTHLTMEQVQMLSGVKMTHVPYKGGGPLSTNLVGGQIPLAAMPLAALMPHIRTGKVKVLAVVLSRRYEGMPDAPTLAESVPGFQNLDASGTWAFGPAGLPEAIVQRLHSAIVTALHVPETRRKIESTGQIVVGNSTREFSEQIAKLADVGGKLVKAIGFKPE